MKNTLLALVIFAMSLSALAIDPGRGHGRGHGNGHYRPMPGPGHYRPGPGHHRPGGPVIVIRPRPIPYPHPMPGRSCQVAMTDSYNRIVRRYWGQEDFNRMCRSALRDCNWDLQRMGAWGYRCMTVRW